MRLRETTYDTTENVSIERTATSPNWCTGPVFGNSEGLGFDVLGVVCELDCGAGCAGV